MDVKRLYVRKIVFQFCLSWKVHWLGKAEVPENYYHRAFPSKMQDFHLFIYFWISLNSLQPPQTSSQTHSIPTDNILHALFCKVNTIGMRTDEARGEEWQMELEDQRQSSDWAGFCAVSFTTTVLPNVLSFCNYFFKKVSQRTSPWWKS